VKTKLMVAALAPLLSACVQIPGVTAYSQSYHDGYEFSHRHYSPVARDEHWSGEIRHDGTNVAATCRYTMALGQKPPDENNWQRGCVDALHELGLRP
jgi:hypothetical protein